MTSASSYSRTAPIVERDQLRRRRRRGGAVVRTLEPLREAEPLAALREQCHRVAVTLAEGGADGVGDTAAGVRRRGEAIDDDEQLLRESDVDRLGEQIVEVADDTVERHAEEALRAQVLDDNLVGDLVGEAQREGDGKARAGRERKQLVGRGLHGIGAHLAPALRTYGAPDARPQ